MLPLGPSPTGGPSSTWVVASRCAVAVAFLPCARLARRAWRAAHPRPAGVSSARGERGSGERLRVPILRRLTPGGDRAKHVPSRLHFVC